MPKIFRFWVYSYLIQKWGKRNTSSTRVIRLPFKLYAKTGSSEALITEAMAAQYIHSNTTIPVPSILDIIQLKGTTTKILILMTEVPGRPLGDMQPSLNDISEAKLSRFRVTLGGWLAQLRNLPRPDNETTIAGFGDGSFKSYRILFDEQVGPYESQDTFHKLFFCTLQPNSSPSIQSLAATIRQRQYKLHLTHGDLSPNNILVDENYVPTGLVDWECAVWAPEYWEYTTAVWRRKRYATWFDTLQQLFPQYEEELAVEEELWKTICPW